MRCAEKSTEKLAGTAPENIHNYILLEYCGVWPKKIKLDGLDLDVRLKEKLSHKIKEEQWKLLLIRKPKLETNHIYWTVAGTIYQQEQLADWDWTTADWREYSKPMLLVCTHGNRDRCCGTLGGATFASLYRQKPEWLWQSSHLGGHRFAPTVLSLPDGMSYGRILEADSEALLSAIEQGEFGAIEKRRGLTKLLRWQQALHVWLAEQQLEAAEVYLISDKQQAIIIQDDEEYKLAVHFEVTGTTLYSCGDEAEKEIGEWRVTTL